MIITLICIGAGIKAFNSEDSDTKTTIKNIPNGIKKSFADWYKCSENRYYNSDRNNYLFNVYNWSDLHLCICKS